MSERLPQAPVIVLALGASTAATLPVFLVGALAGEISRELALTESGIGVLVAVFFAVSASTSLLAGRIVSRLGWLGSLLTTSGLVVVVGLLITALPAHVVVLAGGLVLAGVANGISHPASNTAIVRSIDQHRHGIAFGMKQAAIPTATLLSGAALPLIAVPLGWQTTFLVLAGLAALIVLNGLPIVRRVRRTTGTVRDRAEESYDRTHLRYLAVGVGLGAGACNSVGAFLVLHALDIGVGPGAAGTLLGASGAMNIMVRLALGWDADRRTSGHLQRVGYMMLIGAGGVVLLGAADGIVLLAVGSVIAFAIGWGWNGLLHHGTMRLYGHAAASVTGIVQAAQYVGAVGGPLLVGIMATHLTFFTAWLAVASWLILGGVLVLRFRVLWARLGLTPAVPPRHATG